MIRTDRKVRLCVTLLTLNILFIWGNSLLPGSVSGAISKWVRDLLAFLLDSNNANPNAGHGLVRKLAHFTEFACLGGLFTWLFSMYKKPVALALLFGFLVASLDETIQYFVPNRGPSVIDVLIDTSGVLLGIGSLLIGYTVRKSQKMKTEAPIG